MVVKSLHTVVKASVIHSGFLLPSLIGPFQITICQKSDQDPVIRGGNLLKYVKTFINHDNNQILFRKRPDSAVSSRIRLDCDPAEIRQ